MTSFPALIRSSMKSVAASGGVIVVPGPHCGLPSLSSFCDHDVADCRRSSATAEPPSAVAAICGRGRLVVPPETWTPGLPQSRVPFSSILEA